MRADQKKRIERLEMQAANHIDRRAAIVQYFSDLDKVYGTGQGKVPDELPSDLGEWARKVMDQVYTPGTNRKDINGD